MNNTTTSSTQVFLVLLAIGAFIFGYNDNHGFNAFIIISLAASFGAIQLFFRFQKIPPGDMGLNNTTFNQIRTMQKPIGVAGLSVLVVWLCTQFLLLLPIGLGLMALWFVAFKANNGGSSQQHSDEHGSARWATEKEFAAQGYTERKGLYVGAQYMRSKSGHILTTAGSGQGKGVCLIVPTLLVNPYGSYVVTDPKGENAFITARWQKQAGQKVFIIDPWEEQKNLGARHGIPSAGFNPFVFLKKDRHELRDNCEQIANFLIPDKPDAKDPYWNDRARNMIKTFLMHIITALPEKDHNFWTLYKMLRLSGDDWLELLFDMKNNTAEGELISIAAQEIIGIQKSDNTMSGIRSTAQNATAIFESPQLRASLERNDFDPYQLTTDNCTVYVVIPERFLDTHGVWLRLVIGLCLKACNAKPGHRVNFILDEFAVMGKMKDVQRGYAYARGQNIVLWIFVQSLAQLKEIYGEDGMNTFISNAAVFQAFGIKDHYSAEYISKLLGDATYQKQSTSTSYNGDQNSKSISLQTYGRKLMNPDEVIACAGIIVFSDGLKVVINKVPYFKSTLTNVKLNSEQKKSREEGQAIEWFDEFQKRADPPPRINV